MRSPALAMAWSFRRRHRWGLIALGVYFTTLAAIRLFVVPLGRGYEFADEQTFAFLVLVPTSATFMYMLAVFSFGLDGDLAAPQSIYPARMFTLPVTSGQLAAWPMLCGSAVIACLWLGTRLLAVWPAGVEVPVLWPALLAASLLAWTQALTWMPYRWPGMRVVVTVFWLVTIDAVVMVALEYKASEAVMLMLLAPHLPLAFLTARFAVGRARRGDTPRWHGAPSVAARAGRAGSPFVSAACAQDWYEWRAHGRTLPALVAMLLPFELALLFVFPETPVIVFETLALALLTPPFMARFVAATVSEGPSLVARRPLRDGALVASKLRVTLRSTLAAWVLVAVCVPFALRASGTLDFVVDATRTTIEIFGPARAAVLLLLVIASLVAATWKQLVQGLYVGMSGRPWLIKGSVFGVLAAITALGPALHWLGAHEDAQTALGQAFPLLAAVLVGLKLSAAAWVAIRLTRSKLIDGRIMVAAAAAWSATVFALYGALVWIVPEMLIRGYVLGLVAILAVPLARVSAAPLALHWSRHQ